MFLLRGTAKLLDRLGGPTAADTDRSTTALGDWYAKPLFWRPQVALFVNERTLLPVLVPLAPASGLVDRLRTALADQLPSYGLDATFISAELDAMAEVRLARTNSRQTLGVMNDFAAMADASRRIEAQELGSLSRWLARTPCGPLHQRSGSPDRELVAVAGASRAK
jgi:hypothetical protein